MRVLAGHGARKLLRTLVLRTNRYFPFRYSNQWPYRAAAKAAAMRFGRHAGVLALYLRHGQTSAAWIPGLSDIDLTMVLKRGLSTAAEFDLVDLLWSDYRSLKRYFPMLGELRILGADDLNLWLRETSESPTPRAWTLLAGEPVYDSAADRSPDWRRRCLDFAMWIYLDLIPPCLAAPDSFLNREDLRRRVRKIFRVLKPVLSEKPVVGEDAVVFEEPRAASALALAAQCAIALERAVLRLENGCAGDAEPARTPPSGGARFHSNPSCRLAGVRSAMRFHETVLLVMENGSTAEAIAATMAAAGRCWDLPAVPLPQSVFHYMVRKYDSYNYQELQREREVLYGADPLDMPPPQHSDIATFLLAHVDHELALPRSEWLFSPGQFPSADELQVAFGQIMAVRLLVEKNWVSLVRRDVDAQARREYPECSQALAEIIRMCGSDREIARQRVFALFVDLTQAVRDSLESLRTIVQ
jgi:hypothetical protein